MTREKLKTNKYIFICNVQRFANENVLINMYYDVMKVNYYFTGEISNLFNGIIPVFHRQQDGACYVVLRIPPLVHL